jgi:hypothetical protein
MRSLCQGTEDMYLSGSLHARNLGNVGTDRIAIVQSLVDIAKIFTTQCGAKIFTTSRDVLQQN